MSLTNPNRIVHTAEIPPEDAWNLSAVAVAYGVCTYRQAAQSKEGPTPPVIGFNPNYYAHAADIVLRRASRHDAGLADLLSTARLLMDKPYIAPRMPAHSASVQTPNSQGGTLKHITDILEGQKLAVTLKDKWLTRARHISAFSINHLENVAAAYMPIDVPKAEDVTQACLDSRMHAESLDYWNGVHVRLMNSRGILSID